MKPSCNREQRHRLPSILSVVSLVISIAAVPVAAWLTYHYTDKGQRASEERRLNQQANEGTVALNAMGHLYFATLFRISDFSSYNGGKLSFVSIQQNQSVEDSRRVYFAMLSALVGGAEQLVDNSGYRIMRHEDQPGIEKLAAFGNYFAVEQAMRLNNPLFGTLEFMCRTFGGSYFKTWRADGLSQSARTQHERWGTKWWRSTYGMYGTPVTGVRGGFASKSLRYTA